MENRDYRVTAADGAKVDVVAADFVLDDGLLTFVDKDGTRVAVFRDWTRFGLRAVSKDAA